MKKNVFISNVLTDTGSALAIAFKSKGYYVYGVDRKEDYEGVCDRALRFDLLQFVVDAGYRVRFTQIFDEIMPKLDVLVFCSNGYQPAPLKELQLDQWHATLNTELSGPMILAKLFQSRLEIAKGKILFLFEAQNYRDKGLDLAYSTSQSAVNGLVKAMGFDMKDKINVNAIKAYMDFLENNAGLENYLDDVVKMAVHLTVENNGGVNGSVIDMDGSV